MQIKVVVRQQSAVASVPVHAFLSQSLLARSKAGLKSCTSGTSEVRIPRGKCWSSGGEGEDPPSTLAGIAGPYFYFFNSV